MPSFDLDDETFLRQFEDLSLPFSKWRHRSHIRLAHLYLTRYPFEEALDRIRRGIQRYNIEHRVPDGPLMGYHETMTVAWMRLVASALKNLGKHEDSRAF